MRGLSRLLRGGGHRTSVRARPRHGGLRGAAGLRPHPRLRLRVGRRHHRLRPLSWELEGKFDQKQLSGKRRVILQKKINFTVFLV